MRRYGAVGALLLTFTWLMGLQAGCSVSVTDASGGGAAGNDAAGGGPEGQPADDGAGAGDNGGTDTSDLVESTFNDAEVSTATRFAGDGMAAKRQALAGQYPGLNDLVAGGSETAEAMLAKFSGQPSAEADDQLFVFAYALEQMDYVEGVDRLVTFLEDNITGDVDFSRSAATHAIRQMLGLSLKESAYYLGSEIEQTIEAAGGSSFAKQARFKGDKTICWQEFVLLNADGSDARFPAGHSRAGQLITIGGNVHSSETLNPASVEKIRQEVTANGGTYVDVTESGVTFQGSPSKTFNCAGFVFNEINGGKWTSDPGDWYEALTAAGAIEGVSPATLLADAGDIVFYFNAADSRLPGHVARVKSNSITGDGVVVINADGPTGMFEARWDAAWFYGDGASRFPKYTESRTEVWRWKGGQPPNFRVNTDRSVENSCHGEDNDNDLFPEAGACVSGTPRSRCINPEFLPPTYQVFRVTNYQGFGYLTVRATDTLDSPPLLSNFPGGGIDPGLRAVWAPLTGEEYATQAEAAQSICGRFVRFFRPVLASFIQAAHIDGDAPENYVGVDQIFVSECPDVPHGF